MKSIFSGALVAAAIIASLSFNVQAKTINHSPIIAVSDTGKMAKMKMAKMDKMKMGKMKKDSMKMGKMKMSKKKMAKDTSGKM